MSIMSALYHFKEARPNDLLDLIDFGTCSLHAVDGALRAGCANEGVVMEFLRVSYIVFKDIPSRRADYIEFSSVDNPPFPMKFCATRWVENV